ncbi:MAG: aspartate/glutamate racemase family protein [Alphaproteobacteria bacterium]|nr:aspartate/glutamate racemase family protein [Alphaproteobacteria bacterium]
MTPSNTPPRIAHGGKAVYGARLGILMLEARFPRIPGDMGNAATWPFPVLYKVVRGASPERVVTRRAEGLRDAFIAAAQELVADREIAAAVGVPVATSSLMQAPFLERLLPPGRRVGIVTISRRTLTEEHLVAAGVAPDAPVIGTDDGEEFTRAIIGNEATMDVAAAERDILAAGKALVARHKEIGAIVLECTNMIPYARALSEALGLPVHDMYGFACWFHAGLSPRDFGFPGSAAQEWRGR